ncbi:locomotion-related protein Hikaru genki-like [Aethina tumida]|uniref:locomotion-related protein Hikaru genki-like n=1 Tax=Aethina tumida TaxID=116153 RepID=UPI0021498479|nr:locomotion-related protein Hikaru genki-like [Aethina tumida]
MWFVQNCVVVVFVLSSSFLFTYSKNAKIEDVSTCYAPKLTMRNNPEGNHVHVLKETYSNVKEVKFYGSIGPLGERRLCKIKCIDGQWVGPLCIDEQEKGRFQPLFRNCKLDYLNPNLIITFRNITIKDIGLVYPHGTVLKARCREIGMYKLLGNSTPKCENGVWSSRLPSCVRTTLFTNLTEDAPPPTILFKIPSGSSSIEPGGELAIYPGTTVHLECIFSRHLGSPDWTWTAPLGEYLTGWAIAPEERDWKYRLSIYYAKEQDSATFTCSTPRGITNSIVLHVAAVHCEPITAELDEHMTMRSEGTKLGQKTYFQCQSGYQINGDHNITCQLSGQWSGAVPTCELVKCPMFHPNSNLTTRHLKIEEQSNSYGGRIVFSCEWGYRLVGTPGLECELNGTWSGIIPKCTIIQCSPPIIQPNSNLLVNEISGMDGGKYTVGSLLQFSCNNSLVLMGESTIMCTETGIWSHPLPVCRLK